MNTIRAQLDRTPEFKDKVPMASTLDKWVHRKQPVMRLQRESGSRSLSSHTTRISSVPLFCHCNMVPYTLSTSCKVAYTSGCDIQKIFARRQVQQGARNGVELRFCGHGWGMCLAQLISGRSPVLTHMRRLEAVGTCQGYLRRPGRHV